LLEPGKMGGDPPHPIGHNNVVFTADLWKLLKERFGDRMLYETNWSQAKLASMLRTFEIEPQRIGKRRGKHVLRWYRRGDFDDAIARYAPDIAAAMTQESDTTPDEARAEPATPIQVPECSSE